MTTARILPFLAAAMIAAAQPALAAPAVIVNFVTAGQHDPNAKVPAFNAVPGAGVANLAVAIPQSLLTHGLNYVMWVSLQDLSYTGPCTISYQISQKVAGKNKIIQTQKILTFQVSPGLWGAGIVAKPLVNMPGDATLTGKVTFGTSNAVLSAPIEIQ